MSQSAYRCGMNMKARIILSKQLLDQLQGRDQFVQSMIHDLIHEGGTATIHMRGKQRLD